MPEGSPSVLIIRLDAIGDALALTPLLAALERRSFPVDVVLRPSNAGVFSSRAAREIFVAGFDLRSNAPSNLAAIQRTGRELRSRNYSHVLVATEDPGGYRLAGAVGAPVRIGFHDPWGKPLKALWSRRFLTRGVYRSAGLDPRGPHECEVLFRLTAGVIDATQPIRDAGALRPLVLEREPEPDDRIAVQVTDKWERLGVPFDDVVAMIRRLAANGPLRGLSSKLEADYAQRIAGATGIAISYFDEIEPWKAAIAAAPAIVTPDSGALHVAGMVGTPVVAIFPPDRNYALQVARWFPWAAPHRIVRAGDDLANRAGDALVSLIAT
ncbi:MAG TPA: glycosyltransferase family 9 protein [Candidatus Babeliales bacterium]|nr:glycosyltransferase family 9 protein [Candidatus Babeliales bacterium]